MARTKQTARKRAGPKGVPRGRLAGRRSEYLAQFTGPQGRATSSQPPVQDTPDAWRERKEVEIRALSQEVRDLDEARKRDRRRIRKLKKKLSDSEECKELWRSMLDKVYDQRDAAWDRERNLRTQNQQLSYALAAADQLADQYRDATYTLYHQLYPPQAPGMRAEEADESGLDEDIFDPYYDNGEGADLYDSDCRELSSD